MIELFFVMAFFLIIVFLIYLPAIYHHVMAFIYEKRFQRELKAIEDSGLYEESRIVITRPLGTGTEPAGEISFADAMRNKEFAMKSIMDLVND